MTNLEFVLNGDQRDEIMKAVQAIERQVNETIGKPQWRALWIIGTNLTIIRTNVTNLPQAGSN